MNREHRKREWICRECDCEWNPHGNPFRITCVRDIEASEAAEYAASELDDREWDDFDSWTVGNVNHTHRYIEADAGNGTWRRFRVTARIKVDYESQEIKP